MKTIEEFLDRNLKKIKVTGRQRAFGTSYVQRICLTGYNQARRTIERGMEQGILVRDEYCDWQYRLSSKTFEIEQGDCDETEWSEG